MTGGTFYRTYDPVFDDEGVPVGPTLSADGGPTAEADPAAVSRFRLDKYLVTVGRFRQFVNAWNAGWLPAPGSGKHTHLNSGNGLAAMGGGFEPGWVTADNVNASPTATNLTVGSVYGETWTPTAVGVRVLHLGWWFFAERCRMGVRSGRGKAAARVPVGIDGSWDEQPVRDLRLLVPERCGRRGG